MHNGDFGSEIGQIQRLFDGRIASADNDDLLAPVEKAVAGGARRDAKTHELLFAFNSQPFGLCPGGDDQRIAGPHRA